MKKLFNSGSDTIFSYFGSDSIFSYVGSGSFFPLLSAPAPFFSSFFQLWLRSYIVYFLNE